MAFAIRRAKEDGDQLAAAIAALVENSSDEPRFGGAIRVAQERGFARIERYLVAADRANGLSLELDGAADEGDQDRAAALLTEGARLNAPRHNPTARAIIHGHYGLAEFFVLRGADVHAEGEHALAMVCDQLPSPGLCRILFRLLDHKADPNARDGEFVFFAALMKRSDLLDPLLAWGGDPAHVRDAELANAAQRGNPRTARRLMARGARPHVHRGMALNTAAGRGHADFVEAIAGHVGPAEAKRALAHLGAAHHARPGREVPEPIARIARILGGIVPSAPASSM